MPLQLDDLAALDAPTLESSGRPMLLPLAGIDEDPEQPRKEFDDHALLELAATVRERGVRQPISVRPNLRQAGRWLLNFGARRLRAAKLAGLEEIPAFIDTTADSYDQVIENEQREGLKPLELALFVQKRIAGGDTQAEIAQRLGKSRQYVTLATALIEAPDWLLTAYREGRCRGTNELYELRRLHGEHAQKVQDWVASSGTITRERVGALKAELCGRALQPANSDASSVAAHTAGDENKAAGPRPPHLGRFSPSSHKTDKRIHVELDGQDFQLVVNVAPLREGHVYVRPLAGGPRQLAPASALKVRGFLGR